MSKQGLSNKNRSYRPLAKPQRLCYNGSKKQTRRRTATNYTKHKDSTMSEEALLYDKYGYWSEGEWVPYDDMGAL